MLQITRQFVCTKRSANILIQRAICTKFQNRSSLQPILAPSVHARWASTVAKTSPTNTKKGDAPLATPTKIDRTSIGSQSKEVAPLEAKEQATTTSAQISAIDFSKARASNSPSILISKLTSIVNQITEYEIVEEKVKQVDKCLSAFEKAQFDFHKAKLDYETVVGDRNNNQSETNTLLQRKQNWTQIDLQRYTTLLTIEHELQTRESRQRALFASAEERISTAQIGYVTALSGRYHAEQVWSEKGRRLSTLGTWLLVSFNTVLFVSSVFIVEPYKRDKLVEHVVAAIQSDKNVNQSTSGVENLTIPELSTESEAPILTIQTKLESNSPNSVSGPAASLTTSAEPPMSSNGSVQVVGEKGEVDLCERACTGKGENGVYTLQEFNKRVQAVENRTWAMVLGGAVVAALAVLYSR